MDEQKFSFVATLVTGEKFDLVACNIVKPDVDNVDSAIKVANTVFDLGLSPLESIWIERRDLRIIITSKFSQITDT